MESRYQPIENYGVIGNLRSAALVGMDSSIDWLCLPHFDSPSVFAAILDDRKGGRFRIAPAGEQFRRKQFYWPDTAILVTRFLHDDGVGEVEDYMPVGATCTAQDELIRRVRVVRGQLSFHLECRPAFDYARGAHECHLDANGARFDGPGLSLGLAAPIPLRRDGAGVVADFTLDHLEGYRGSRPVRIGNGAYAQLQLDIYGELMDGVYLHNKYVEPLGYDGWVRLRRLVDWVCDNWKREDEGI